MLCHFFIVKHKEEKFAVSFFFLIGGYLLNNDVLGSALQFC